MLGRKVSRGHVDQIDGFVRQGALGNILNRVVDGSFEDAVRQDDVMVLFIQSSDSLENLERIFCAWSLDLNFIETSCQCCIFHDRIAILVLCRCTDDADLAARKGRLQNISQSLRTVAVTGRAGTQNLVNLIEEQDDIAGILDLFDEFLNVFFEASAILSTGFKR